eukprot:gene13129-3451_t
MSLKGVCQNPYADVCYASTEEDERVRKNLQIDMSTCVGRDMHVRRRKQMGVPKGKRFPVKVTNGNLQAAIPGLVPSTLKSGPLEPHDFLIRSMGIDKDGNIAVGDFLRQGQQIRFMVRDRQGAMEDLKSHGLALKRAELQASLEGQPLPQAVGMMVFSCNGRGQELYQEESWDTKTMASFVGPVLCSGFLCNGEIGKVGETTHLHGFTAAVAVLRMTGDTALGYGWREGQRTLSEESEQVPPEP